MDNVTEIIWSPALDAEISRLSDKGKKPKAISRVIGLPTKAIESRVIYLDREKEKAKSDRKKRLCLGGCGKQFVSRGPGNRICPNCSKRERGMSTSPLHLPGYSGL